MLIIYAKKLNIVFPAVLFVLLKPIVRFKSNADENSVIVFIWTWLFMVSVTLDKIVFFRVTANWVSIGQIFKSGWAMVVI